MQSMGALIKILVVNQLQHLPREARSTIAKESIAAAIIDTGYAYTLVIARGWVANMADSNLCLHLVVCNLIGQLKKWRNRNNDIHWSNARSPVYVDNSNNDNDYYY